MEKKPSGRTLRKWTELNMGEAYKAVKAGKLSISAAAKQFSVPRMTLTDRVSGRKKLNAKMGPGTALTAEEEDSLCHYIEYMAKRGFPLTIDQIIGFAYCIAKEHGKDSVFKKTGPSKKWWRGFKKRHPNLGLRRPDALDRGRATMGNVNAIRDYFRLLKDTMDTYKLHDKPHQIYNCDEAALYLNKSAGQRVVVPVRQKHAHTVSAATSEHISVHCCVNAAGQAIPPMLIFSKSLPGGPYHRNGPINASYACSETGFMNQDIYHEWFEKTFLAHSVPQRPLLLIQDGASSHICGPLIRSAIANDVILLCLPPKTTHITQPLDVAVYRKMKIEASKLMSQAKLVKSDLWVAKKAVSGIFKLIYEKTFTMSCIIEGFRKCGISPFNPNAIDKNLLLRSCQDIDVTNINLAEDPVDSETVHKEKGQAVDNLPLVEEQETDSMSNEEGSAILADISFIVGEDGVLSLEAPNQMITDTENTASTSACPPELALAAVETGMKPRKKRKYKECLEHNVDLPHDRVYQTWKSLISKTSNTDSPSMPSEETMNVRSDKVYVSENTDNDQSTNSVNSTPSSSNVNTERSVALHSHPLVKAGLISQDLVNVLLIPSMAKQENKIKKKAKVLTSEEVKLEIEEKERKKKELEENKLKRKKEQQLKQVEKTIAKAKRLEEIRIKKEMKEKEKAEKEKLKLEKAQKSKPKRKSNGICGKNIDTASETTTETDKQPALGVV